MGNQICISQLSTSLFFCKLLFEVKKIDVVGNKAKGRISKRVFQESKAPKISEKQTFLTP